ncbi:MAG: hypothetical protein LAT67_05070 [Balneolales bacterium]|nr:hypothetical protein [Balneolales bacterium]
MNSLTRSTGSGFLHDRNEREKPDENVPTPVIGGDHAETFPVFQDDDDEGEHQVKVPSSATEQTEATTTDANYIQQSGLNINKNWLGIAALIAAGWYWFR